MFCHVIQLRRDGLRLRQQDWPEPVSGELEMRCTDGSESSFRRTIRKAVVYVPTGVAQRPVGRLHLFEPVLLHTLPDGLVLRGIELRAAAEGIFEHEQMWLCLFKWDGQAPRGLEKRLPEAIDPK